MEPDNVPYASNDNWFSQLPPASVPPGTYGNVIVAQAENK